MNAPCDYCYLIKHAMCVTTTMMLMLLMMQLRTWKWKRVRLREWRKKWIIKRNFNANEMPNASNWASEREIAFLTGENGILLNCGTLTVSGVWTKTPAQKLQILTINSDPETVFSLSFRFRWRKKCSDQMECTRSRKVFLLMQMTKNNFTNFTRFFFALLGFFRVYPSVNLSRRRPQKPNVDHNPICHWLSAYNMCILISLSEQKISFRSN